jgi:hypothetical protein
MFGLGRKLAAGKVIDKKHYPGVPGKPQSIVGTKAAAFVAPATQPILEGWALQVKGTDESGQHDMTRWIYVDESTYNNLEKGDTYTTQEKSK